MPNSFYETCVQPEMVVVVLISHATCLRLGAKYNHFHDSLPANLTKGIH